jgi:hypothetical protein
MIFSGTYTTHDGRVMCGFCPKANWEGGGREGCCGGAVRVRAHAWRASGIFASHIRVEEFIHVHMHAALGSKQVRLLEWGKSIGGYVQ